VLEITGEVVPECRDRAIALLWIFLERFGYDRVEVSEKRTAKLLRSGSALGRVDG